MSATFDIPGKIFLLGEYAVLASHPALLIATGPRFSMTLGAGDGTRLELGKDTPNGKLLEWVRARGGEVSPVQFQDPHRGLGGFGGSAAEFALLYYSHAVSNRWTKRDGFDIWKLFREFTASSSLPPSGADIVAQAEGGAVIFDPSHPEKVEDVWSQFDWSNVLVFSAARDRKVRTYKHLEALGDQGFPYPKIVNRLKQPLLRGLAAVRSGDGDKLGRALDEYANLLWREGLEHEQAHEDRKVLAKFPGVAGVKGAGAMLADVMVVLLKPEVRAEADQGEYSSLEKILKIAQSRGLVLVSDGIAHQPGLRQVH